MSQSAIVNILNRQQKSIGTGFFVSADGYIMTCSHVTKNSVTVSENDSSTHYIYIRTTDSQIFEAEVIEILDGIISIDGEPDGIAILKAPFPVSQHYRFSARKLTGSKVRTYGYPEGAGNQVAVQNMQIVNYDSGSIQLKNANNVSVGFSGAPLLLDEKGISMERIAVGLIDMISGSRYGRLLDIAWAIDSDLIIRYAGDYIEVLPETVLSTDPESDNPFAYNYSRRLAFVGQKEELEQLENFCRSDQGLWWAVTGQGGSGKSRLALEFANQKRNEGWDVYYNSRSPEKTYKKALKKDLYDSLIILEGTLENVKTISELLRKPSQKRANHIRKIKILLLLRSTQQKTIDDYVANNSAIAELQYRPAEDKCPSFLEIGSLTDDELKQIISGYARIDINSPTVNKLLNTLKKIDPDNSRPLYAMFIADAYKAKKRPQQWDRVKVLDYICNREKDIWWDSTELRKPIKQNSFIKIIALTTFLQKCSFDDAKRLLKEDFTTVKKSAQSQKDVLRKCGFLKTENGEAYISAMQPDIIGEYFVLKYFESCDDLDAVLKTFLGEASSEQWATLWYLIPLLHDHPEQFISLKLYEYIHLQDIESMDDLTQLLYIYFLAELTVHGSEELVKQIENTVDQFSWKMKNDYYFEAAALMIDEPVEFTESFIQKMRILLIKNSDTLTRRLIAYCLCKLIETSEEHAVKGFLSDFESLYTEYDEDEIIAVKYCEALAIAIERSKYTEAVQFLDQLEDICFRFIKNTEIGSAYIKGLRTLSEKTDYSETISYVIKGEHYFETYNDDEKINELLLDWVSTLVRNKTGGESLRYLDELRRLQKRFYPQFSE